jgi:hypothetical protein
LPPVKEDQSVKKSLKSVKPALLALGVLLLLVFLGRIASFLFSLNQPYTPGLADFKSYPWDTKSSYNLLYAVQNEQKKLSEISFINLQPRQKEVTILHISDLVYVDVPRGYGEWTIGSIFPLGQEDGGRGTTLLRLAVSRLVGLPLDGIVINQGGQSSAEELISSLRKNQLAVLGLAGNIKSNVTTWELLTLSKFLSSVRTDKVISLDLAKSTITESKLLPDSSRVLGIDNIQLDSFIRNNLADAAFTDENVTIAIFNATSHPGLAQSASRMVTNMGGTVVFIGNTETYQAKTVVLDISDDPSSLEITKKRLIEIFAPWCQKEVCTSSDPKVTSARSQLVIVLGEDFYSYWNKR